MQLRVAQVLHALAWHAAFPDAVRSYSLRLPQPHPRLIPRELDPGGLATRADAVDDPFTPLANLAVERRFTRRLGQSLGPRNGRAGRRPVILIDKVALCRAANLRSDLIAFVLCMGRNAGHRRDKDDGDEFPLSHGPLLSWIMALDPTGPLRDCR